MSLTNKLKQAGKKALPFLLAGALLNPIQAQEKKEKSDWLYHGLEISYIALHYIDYKTTLNAINNGATELNPIAKPFAENPYNDITFGLFKTGTTFVALYSCRKLKETHPKLAYASLIGINLLWGQRIHRHINLDLKFNLNK